MPGKYRNVQLPRVLQLQCNKKPDLDVEFLAHQLLAKSPQLLGVLWACGILQSLANRAVLDKRADVCLERRLQTSGK